MPLWEEWMLIDGLNEFYSSEAVEGGNEESRADRESQAPQVRKGHKPSRDEPMATGEELVSLGIQYSQE